MQENLKLLIKYIVDSFWDQLVKFEYLVSIHSLKVKYEQVFSYCIYAFLPKIYGYYECLLAVLRLHACLQCMDNDGTKGTAIMNNLRRRLDERALEKEEEDYFNEERYVCYSSSVIGDSIQLAWTLLTFSNL